MVAGLAAPERNKVKKQLQKYAYAFVTNNRKQVRTGMVKHETDTGEARPIKQSPRSIPLAKRNAIKELIDERRRNGVMEPSSGPWSSPVASVKKKDGSTKFCVDYRKLRIYDTLDTLVGT